MTTSTLKSRLKFKPKQELGARGEWLVSEALESYEQSEGGYSSNYVTSGRFRAFIEVLAKFFPLQESENGYSEEAGWDQALGWRRNIELLHSERSREKQRPRRF